MEKAMSNIFESSMPTLQYIFWNPLTYWARQGGWTEQEKLYHNFFRGDYILWNMQAQSMHPSAFIERHRADSFYRRVRTFLPGCEMPEWAKHTNRAVDFDYEGMLNPFRAQATVLRESTPKPHYGYAYPSSICHIGNWRWSLGRFMSRYFYNEEIRGGVATGGRVTDNEKEMMNSWYADSEGRWNLEANTPEQTEAIRTQAERWIKNIKEFYPEQSNYKKPATLDRVDEPYFMRSLTNVIHAIFIGKWSDAIRNNAFTNEELQSVYEFYLQERDDVFFNKDSEGVYHATQLYNKFVTYMGLPNVMELDKYTARVVEDQYLDKWQQNYNVTIDTVESYGRVYKSLLKSLPNFECTDMNRQARAYLTEEVYNPLFKLSLMNSEGLSESSESVVGRILSSKGQEGLEVLARTSSEVSEQLHFLTPEVNDNVMKRIRGVVKTFPFKAYNVPKVQF